LFFVPLSIGAILLTWGANRRIYHFVLAGLLLGMGFMIKYVIAADALALGLFLLWQGLRQQNLVQAVFRQCLPLTLAFLVPPLLTYNYYVNIGQADAFLFYTFEVTSRYPVEKSWGALILYTLDFFGRYSPFVFLAIFALRERLTTDRYWQNFLLLWLICATIMTLLPGKTFGHAATGPPGGQLVSSAAHGPILAAQALTPVGLGQSGSSGAGVIRRFVQLLPAQIGWSTDSSPYLKRKNAPW
jgi:4-amino-4-deoxy-L-arabinose transferase-like glycosyltransferase